MSRRLPVGWHAVVVVTALTRPLAIPLPACAQESVPTAAEYRQRTERLVELWRQAEAAAQRAESVLIAQTAFDSTRVGPFIYVTRGPASPKEREGMRLVQARLEAVLGSNAAGLPTFTMFLERRGVEGPRPVQLSTQIRVAGYLDSEPAEVIADRVISEVATPVHQLVDQALRDWVGLFPLGPMPEWAWQHVYVDLVTSRATVTRLCFVGSIEACRRALVLERVEAPATAWYDSTGRRWAVGTMSSWDIPRPLRHLQTTCTADGSDASCLELLRALDQRYVPRPLQNPASLLHVSLRLGGAGAFQRLMSDPTAPLATRLAAAAGMPADSLIVAWRDTVLAHRPAAQTITRRSGWAAFAWILVLVVVATRSTRWRLG